MGAITSKLSGWLGRRIGRYLTQPSHSCGTSAPTDPNKLLGCVQPGDVVLVEGNTRVSVAIKYLTQSTWSHAAIYVGDASGLRDADGERRCFVEADLVEGVHAVSVAGFRGLHCRVCRPVGLSTAEIDCVIRFVLDRLGHRYDLKNIVDLARYLFPTPPVPVRWRRRMLALGSGDPTRAICSTMIAQAFQSVRYPILPIISAVPTNDPSCPGCFQEVLRVRHHSLFVPRDFDVSPYFEIVKPALHGGFDHRSLQWEEGRPPVERHIAARAAEVTT